QAEIALHHEIELAHHLRHAERAGQHAVGAPDAAGLQRRLHDAELVLLDRVGRAHLGAGRVGAVHADHGHGLGALDPVDVVEVDHRVPTVGAALLAGLDAGPAADAAALVHHEDPLRPGSREPRGRGGHVYDGPPVSDVSRRSRGSRAPGPTRSMRTAQTLYSGMRDSGSRTGLVSWLAACVPAQW